MTDLAPHLSLFLGQHLPRDQRASQHTIDNYDYTFTLLIEFVSNRLGIRPSKIKIEQITVDLILDFLDNLEKERGNAIRTRNLRLAAIKSFFRYLEYRAPACLNLALQVHAIPSKRFDRGLVDYLNGDEIEALLDAPDPRTSTGVRDRAMLHLAYTAGLRVSEIIALKRKDLGHNIDSVYVMGKGRRERVLPLWKETKDLLERWLAIRPDSATDHLFLNARGTAMSRHGFAHRLAVHVRKARQQVPSMADKRVSPHVLRHSCAMHTLRAAKGDITKVSMWLGHASILSTQVYLHADPLEKMNILEEQLPPRLRRGFFRNRSERLLAGLKEPSKP